MMTDKDGCQVMVKGYTIQQVMWAKLKNNFRLKLLDEQPLFWGVEISVKFEDHDNFSCTNKKSQSVT
jgi:hypothetical protein